ncbi:hypothetical protein P7K49_025987, partial [Saguinus oedipus]
GWGSRALPGPLLTGGPGRRSPDPTGARIQEVDSWPPNVSSGAKACSRFSQVPRGAG